MWRFRKLQQWEGSNCIVGWKTVKNKWKTRSGEQTIPCAERNCDKRHEVKKMEVKGDVLQFLWQLFEKQLDGKLIVFDVWVLWWDVCGAETLFQSCLSVCAQEHTVQLKVLPWKIDRDVCSVTLQSFDALKENLSAFLICVFFFLAFAAFKFSSCSVWFTIVYIKQRQKLL